MKNQKKIGKKIKAFREFRKISREDLALKANLDEGQLEAIEEKGSVPSLGHLIKISRAWEYESVLFWMIRKKLARRL